MPVMKEVRVIVDIPAGPHREAPRSGKRSKVRGTVGPGLPLVVWDLPGDEGRRQRQEGASSWRGGVGRLCTGWFACENRTLAGEATCLSGLG